MRRRHKHSLMPEVNLTNMIDVIFAVLVIFMITAPLSHKGIKVNLPKVEAEAIEEKKNHSNIYQSKKTNFYQRSKNLSQTFSQELSQSLEWRPRNFCDY